MIQTNSDKLHRYTAGELSALGRDDIPQEFVTHAHMVYSSPATLAFNSPGAQGFGVKRAGLAVPGSVMLLVAPGCCGRNTNLMDEMPEYEDRFFFLLMDETDLVTGRHLRKIPKAVKEVTEYLEEKGKRPSCVMICITCVDALLGTDMERVCQKAREAAGLPVRPCYMYALTREGRKPPMTYVRESVYSMLEPSGRKSTTVNLLGYFAHLRDDCELYELLKSAGIKKINEISRCADYEEYLGMSQANFNLVLNAEARLAAQDMEKRLDMPYIEMRRMYQLQRIENQYASLGAAIGATFETGAYRESAQRAIDDFVSTHGSVRVALGEMANADVFELALTMAQAGIDVPVIYGTVTEAEYPFIDELAAISPDTVIMANLAPSMVNYVGDEAFDIDLTVGKDAAWYHPTAAHVMWSEEVQPFGFEGVKELFEQMKEALS
ncbi:MAG: nitrogenase component 1 [Eubacterium sp.]|nr:nitrogenase component 1 [Eubacterium sp.]